MRKKPTPEERRERRRLWQRQRIEADRVLWNAKRQASRRRHRETTTAATRGYYWRKREAQLARVSAYFKANPEKKRASEAKRRAGKRGCHAETIDYGFIKDRDAMICHICRRAVSERDLHFDHVIPLSRGGPHVTANIAVSHARCNLRKGATVASLF